MLTLQIIATVFLGLGILFSIIKDSFDCIEEITGDITGCFIANLLLSLLLQLPKAFIIVVIWLK